MYVPDIGDTIELMEDWPFKLHFEDRNMDLWCALKGYDSKRLESHYMCGVCKKCPDYGPQYKGDCTDFCACASMSWANRPRGFFYEGKLVATEAEEVVLPRETQLKVDRIYIRKGASDYSSITFYIMKSPLFEKKTKSKSKGRFWAKLDDVNKMYISKVETVIL